MAELQTVQQAIGADTKSEGGAAASRRADNVGDPGDAAGSSPGVATGDAAGSGEYAAPACVRCALPGGGGYGPGGDHCMQCTLGGQYSSRLEAIRVTLEWLRRSLPASTFLRLVAGYCSTAHHMKPDGMAEAVDRGYGSLFMLHREFCARLIGRHVESADGVLVHPEAGQVCRGSGFGESFGLRIAGPWPPGFDYHAWRAIRHLAVEFPDQFVMAARATVENCVDPSALGNIWEEDRQRECDAATWGSLASLYNTTGLGLWPPVQNVIRESMMREGES